MKAPYAIGLIAALGCASTHVPQRAGEQPFAAQEHTYPICATRDTSANIRGEKFVVSLAHPTMYDTLWISPQGNTWRDGTPANGIEFTVLSNRAITRVGVDLRSSTQTTTARSDPKNVTYNPRCSALVGTFNETSLPGRYVFELDISDEEKYVWSTNRSFTVLHKQ